MRGSTTHLRCGQKTCTRVGDLLCVCARVCARAYVRARMCVCGWGKRGDGVGVRSTKVPHAATCRHPQWVVLALDRAVTTLLGPFFYFFALLCFVASLFILFFIPIKLWFLCKFDRYICQISLCPFAVFSLNAAIWVSAEFVRLTLLPLFRTS